MIWLSGPPRSGTTMLSLMLAGGGYLPECTAITEIFRLYQYFAANPDPRYRAILGEPPKMRDKFRRVMDILLEGLPSSAVLKDPNLCLYLNSLAELRTHARVIIVIRDPREVIASFMEVRRKQGAGTTVAEAINVVMPHYIAIEQTSAIPGLEALIIKYADVVVRDPDTIRRIESFAGKPVSLDAESGYAFDRSDAFISDLYGKPVSGTRLGAYAGQLTVHEISEVENAFAGIIARNFPELIPTFSRR
jgi:Sulfotransferase family